MHYFCDISIIYFEKELIFMPYILSKEIFFSNLFESEKMF